VRVRSLRSLPLATLRDLSLRVKSDGSGTISFGSTQVLPRVTPGGRFGTLQVIEPPAFERIEHARKVHDLILAAGSGGPRSF
jgi:hypothetical protein